ncbi:Glycosyl transferase family 2 [Tranquillimonas rosea]|uniref:Glycosyl transferase family 2 n=1 Tax=Tranquillimonas rosea TaxID=641238 RepID=A0A1H9WZA6_9RHOB|nr:glycosyltransferase family 2 protein [Tranquillimonas rosea]SES39288.1 Glycosyl transferase family 2 [Tranquillimonas rosea]
MADPDGTEVPRHSVHEDVYLVTAVAVPSDLDILPHFLGHYLDLGIAPENILVILNVSAGEDRELLTGASNVLEQFGVTDPEIWTGPYSSIEMWRRRRDLQAARVPADAWVLSADVDELHVYPDGIAPVLDEMETRGFDWLQGPMIDRLAADGRLRPVEPGTDIFAQFPLEGDLMCQISRRPELKDQGGTVKTMLCAGLLFPGLGGHGLDFDRSAEEAGRRAAELGLDPAKRAWPGHPRLRRIHDRRPANAAGENLAGHPRIKEPGERLAFPIHVAHFKWRAALARHMAERRASGLQTDAARAYTDLLLDLLEEGGDRIDPAHLARARGPRPPWRRHLQTLRRQAERRAGAFGPVRAWSQDYVRPAPGWSVRQLTFGSGHGVGHFHSYYDIPVMDRDCARVAAVRLPHPPRTPRPGDAVEVGVVDIGQGGFRSLGHSRAWSWQQGPMLQWVGGALVWNDRANGRFVARIRDPEGGARLLDRPVYAVDPAGEGALSLDFARLNALRPGYGYAGLDREADLSPAPGDDGLWHLDLGTGAARLVLSLQEAREVLERNLPPDERRTHRETPFVYWFNHCKFSPDGRRFTVKLRWRRRDGPWNGTMGVSLTCGVDGSAPRVVARGASHVMWLDDARLYFWNQRDGRVVLAPDAEATDPPAETALAPEVFGANVHLRHLAEDPDRMIFDTPYATDVSLAEFDRRTGETMPIAEFGGHRPPKGEYRCDLHPVPSPDGRRIIVTSLCDGGRQIYVLDRETGS